MIEAKEVTKEEKYAKELEALRAMRTVAWAKISGDYLYVCTAWRKLRYFKRKEGEPRYMPQIIIRMDITTAYARPRFKYRWGELSRKVKGPMESGISKTKYANRCIGTWANDYIVERERAGLKAGAEVMMQMLQAIY